MTGKTHMAISAATVAAVLAAGQAAGAKGIPYLLMPERGIPDPGPYAIAGLLLLGIVAGLFPDLDAPDSELQHLPRRTADRLGWYVTAWMPRPLRRPGIRGKRGMRGYALPVRLLQGATHLAVLPFTLLVSAVGAGLRACTGHRGFTHTLLGALVFTCVTAGTALIITASVDWSLAVGAVWFSGYASHLAADACTPSGIPLFMVPAALKRPGRASTSASASVTASLTGDLSNRPARWSASRRPVGGGAGRGEQGRHGVWVYRADAPSRRATHHTDYPGSPGSPGHRGYRGAPTFHLLPKRMRVRTGTIADTLLIRWTAWTVCAVAVIRMFVA
ncbi:MAG: metal-dependent hydrolase [Chloroflexi bacterium]|nr:metal-dependent hydrolase [Chloroflexota bacterium]